MEPDLSSSTCQALIAVRLRSVTPDAAALRLIHGLLNLSHRNGSANPAPSAPGERTRIRITFNPPSVTP